MFLLVKMSFSFVSADRAARELSRITDALDLSKKTLGTIRGNLLWALIYNVIGIPIAALGFLHPMYGAAAMALSSLFVVTNSLRIK